MSRTKKTIKKPSKKSLAKRKLTIIKVLPKNGSISQEDLDKWHEVFRTNSMTHKEALATGEVEIENVPIAKKDEHFLTIVRVGNDTYQPSMEDLEQWRDVFAGAEKDPNFKIFTHNAINIEVIEIGKVLAVE
jgi:hypothetical protein